MKYCLKYTNLCTKLTKCDEISIKYIEDKGLVDFMEKFKSQRIILCIKPSDFSKNELRKLVAIHNQYPEYNFAVGLNSINLTLMDSLKAADIPFFVRKPCVSWEEFHFLVNYGVSDINISGPLSFELSKVKQVLETLDRKIVIRATPNKVEKVMQQTDSLISFYIRPEDTDVYEGYIDVFEFEGLEHQDVFYSIYAENKSFIGKISQYVYDFEKPVNNKGLISLFGERRRDCGQQCLKGGHCRRCYDMGEIAKNMESCIQEQIAKTIELERERLK